MWEIENNVIYELFNQLTEVQQYTKLKANICKMLFLILLTSVYDFPLASQQDCMLYRDK